MNFNSIWMNCVRRRPVWWGFTFLWALPILAAEPGVRCEFTTVAADGKHAPKHVLAAWITDAKTNFVKTVARHAGKRQKYLLSWTAARKGEAAVDGVTGATLATHGTQAVTWDGCDAQGKPVSAGTYYLFVEFTEAHSQGPLAAFPVAIGAERWTRTLPDEKHLKDIKLTFTPRED